MTIVSPLEIVIRGPARAAARLFRYDGRLHVVAIAKTRLTLVADGRMVPSVPPDVTVREAVPYRPACDVTFTGKVHVRGGNAAPQTVARIALLRPSTPGGGMDNAETLLNKALGAFEIVGFGPIPSGARYALIPTEERASVDAPMPELRSTTNFAYFHRAPIDQRTVPLRGDEWLYLERLHPAAEQLASQLPMLAAVGAIRLPTQEKPIAMRIDTLTIDGESGTCDVVARGSFAVASTSDLERLAAIVGFDVGRAETAARVARGTMLIEPAAPAAPPPRPPPPPPAAAPPPERRASTVILEPTEEPAPITVQASALESRKDAAPATRAPFEIGKARTGRSPSGGIPGAPWAAEAAPRVKPAEEATDGTIAPDDGVALGETLRKELERREREAAENAALDKAKKKEAAARKTDTVQWRNLPEDQAGAPKVPAAPKPQVAAPTAAVKKSLYDRFRKS